MKISMVLFSGLLISCVHTSYPGTAALRGGKNVGIAEETPKGCKALKPVFGTIRNDSLKSAVKYAFNMARNKASLFKANVIVYRDLEYNKLFADHTVNISFDTYKCPQKIGGNIPQSQATAHASAAKAKSEAEATAAMNAANAARQAASQAAMNAANAAATQAAMNAANAAAMQNNFAPAM